MNSQEPIANSQNDLPLFQAPPSDASVLWLERYLKEVADWVPAARLAELQNRPGDEGKRWIRAVAEASEWVISGQKGYKHLEHTTAEEVNHFVNWMERQGKKMIARAERVKRNAHSVFG